METSLVLFGLFVVLSPGLILTLPSLSKDQSNLKGVADSTGAHNICTGSKWTTDAGCKKSIAVWASQQTSPLAVLIHMIVFSIVLYGLSRVAIVNFSRERIMKLGLLFAILSPGLFITLPSLSAADCAAKHVTNYNESFCTGVPVSAINDPFCTQCESLLGSGYMSTASVIVHGILYAIMATYA